MDPFDLCMRCISGLQRFPYFDDRSVSIVSPPKEVVNWPVRRLHDSVSHEMAVSAYNFRLNIFGFAVSRSTDLSSIWGFSAVNGCGVL